MNKVQQRMLKIAAAISKKPDKYTISDIEAERKKLIRNAVIGGVGFGPFGAVLGAALSNPAKHLEDIGERRAASGEESPEVDPRSGIYVGPYHKVDYLDKEGFKKLYKKLLRKEYEGKGWSGGRSDVARMRAEIISAINKQQANVDAIEPGQLASLVYPYAYNVA